MRELVTCLLTTLMTISVQSEASKDTENRATTDSALKRGLRTLITNSEALPTFQMAVMHLTALREMFARIPYITRHMKDSSSLSLITFLWKSDPVSPTCDDQHPSATEKALSDTAIVKQDEIPGELMEYCLTFLEVVYEAVENQNEAVSSTEDEALVETSVLPSTSTDSAALGLLQSALFSKDCSTGLLNGSGATCLSSWSPLLDAELRLDCIGDPWQDMEVLIVQTCLRLPRILLLLLDSGAAGRLISRMSSRKTTSLPAEMESRWCSVLYNYMELITNPELSNLNKGSALVQTNHAVRLGFLDRSYPHDKEMAERFESLIRSLLVRIVGPKHYRQLQDIHRLAHWIQRARDTCVNVGGFLSSPQQQQRQVQQQSSQQSQTPQQQQQQQQPASSYVPQMLRLNSPTGFDAVAMQSLEPFSTQLRLPYNAQREILHTISSCLSIAYNRPHCWQRFCLKCPDTLIFLAHASLVLDREISRNMLILIQLAVASSTISANQCQDPSVKGPQVSRSDGVSHTAEMRLALSMARHLIPTPSARVSTSGSDALPDQPAGLTSTVQPLLVSPLLFQFIRVFLCHCPDSTIRTSAMHVVRAIYKSMSSQTQRRLLQVMPLIWPELSTFAPYATQFVRLTTEMLIDHPTWSGRPAFLYRVVQLMLRRLEAVRRHPRRTVYTSIMHLVQPPRDNPPQITADVTTLRRIIPELTTQRSTLTAEAAVSRSWSAVASLKPPPPPPTSAPTAQISNSVTPVSTPTTEVSNTDTDHTTENDELGLGGLGCVLELEPCLMCHSKAVEEPSYVILRWDSEPGSSRLPVRVVHFVIPTHYGKFVSHLEQALSQQQQLLGKQSTSTSSANPSTPAVSGQQAGTIGITPTSGNHSTTTVPPAITSSVPFNFLYKRPRYVRTLNIYTSDLIERSTSRLVHEPALWQKVATVHLAPNQTAVCLCFAHPSPVPSWLGCKDYATDVRFSPERLHIGGPSSVQRVNVGHGLPIRASRLIFEYAEFHSTGAEAKRVCPRCHASNLLGSTCLACHTNPVLCCSRAITRSRGSRFRLPTNCHPVTSPVLQCVQSGRTNPQMDIVQCLNELAMAPLGTDCVKLQPLNAQYAPEDTVAPKRLSTSRDKALLASLTASTSSVGSVNATLARLASCVTEASAISLDTAAITRRLWATRQSVMEFDMAQQKSSQAIKDSSGHCWWPDYEALDKMFDPPVGGCYSCLLNAILHCGRLLLGVAEHSLTEDLPDNNDNNHWLFGCGSTDVPNSVPEFNQKSQVPLLQQLVTALTEFGLSVYPRRIQSELQSLIIQLTRDSPPLISHLGQHVTTRLVQAASSCHGNQAHLVSSLVLSDVSLLQASVETILPRASPTEIPGHMRPMDKRATAWEMRLRPLFRVIVGLTKPSRINRVDTDSTTRSTNPATLNPPIVQTILLPLLETLETLAAHGPATQSLGTSVFSTHHVPRETPTPNHSLMEQAKVMQLGAKGETRPPRHPITSGLSTIVGSRGIPPVNFNAWLNEYPHALYSAWSDRLSNRSHSTVVGTDVAVGGANQNNQEQQSAEYTGFANSRQKALANRFASRWRAVVSELRWARKWGIALNQPLTHCPSPNDPIPSDNWLTTVLFDPPDATARAVHVCMNLLKTLSTCPNRARRQSKSSTSAPTHKSRHSALFNLCMRRRRLILRYLTETCLPRLNELASARGSAVMADPYGSYSPLPSNAALLNAGNAFIFKFRQLIGSPDSPGSGCPSSVENTESGPAPLVSYLLVKVNFLSHVARLVERLLVQMQRLESTTLRHWNELVAATMGPVSGTGALNGSTPSHTIALVAELLRILEPLTTLNVLSQYSLTDHQAALYLWKRMCVPVCPFDTDQAVFNVSLEVWRGHEDYLLTRSRTELVSSDTRGFGPTIHDVIDYICTGNNLTTDMRLEIVCENQILMPELRLQDVYTQVWCANRNNTDKPMRLLYRIPGLEADNLPYVEQLDAVKVPPEQYSHLSVLASHPHGLSGLLKQLGTIEDPVQTRDLMNVIFHILGFCLKIDECRAKIIDPELK
ncbi:unnamed protein product [Echinostoma caproni]|uniref:E3 ubiquitin ligase UBR4 C-terminal domain-containing protein n=1 Tax=Echinostoma caproni TaxID=27848 RepID=A0A3P8GQK1_9TREM|nr:unnamed protein product [Echinostoma caproni]